MTHVTARLFRPLLLCLALAAGGCATQAANSVTLAPEISAQIEVLNAGLHSEAELTGGEALYEDKILSGYAIIQSHVDEKLVLEGRWSFEDNQGYPMPSANRAWKTVFLNAREELKVQGRASAPMAMRAKYELRRHSGKTND